MLIEGINDTDEELMRLKETIGRIRPDKVQLNTVVRPPLEPWVKPVPSATLEHAKSLIGQPAEIIVASPVETTTPAHRNISRRIIEVLQRRPVTHKDLRTILNINPVELTKHIARLIDQQMVKVSYHSGNTFYEITDRENE
jgi:wyosine [tRNA(Phe)-imidazoG37] synthetase (radical SAM superfamily)